MFNLYYYLSDPGLLLASPVTLGMAALWLWMLIHCVQHDPDRHIWLWVLILIPLFGPLVYFFARWIPQARMKPPAFLSKLTRGKELQRLQVAARQIGNAHQFVQLGDAQREVGQYEKAVDSYTKALEKDANNLQALWGMAQVELHWKQFKLPVLDWNKCSKLMRNTNSAMSHWLTGSACFNWANEMRPLHI